jgi:hypothetical protein
VHNDEVLTAAVLKTNIEGACERLHPVFRHLMHGRQRRNNRIAGMQKAHADLNRRKIAEYILDLVEK